ncbi:MAG TPA: ABC transporter ATP-binding protein, partial [Thermoplasmata archaeon]|nr:ABC transporter ATP-binding protein [Thermoplasmata archaeon]
EAEELCQRIAVLSRGRIVARDTVAGLRKLVGGDRTIEVEAYGFDDGELGRLNALPGVSRVMSEEFGPLLRLTMRVRTNELTLEAVRGQLVNHPELAVRERRTSLEDIYLDLVEEEAS